LFPTVALGDDGAGAPLAPGEVGPSTFATAVVAKKIDSLAKLGKGDKSPAWPAGANINRPVVSAGDYASLKAEAAKAPKAPKPAGPAPLSTTTLVGGFNGPSQCGPAGELCWFPPDTNASVGPGSLGQEVAITNSKITVFNKSGGLLADTKLSTFMGYTAQALFDPRIEYDQIADRWFAAVEAFQNSATEQRFFLAVSNTSDATGGWCVFNTNLTFFGNNDFFDYPQMALMQDAVVITGNIFPAAGGYAGADAFGWPKPQLYNCKGFSFNVFTGLPGTTTPSNVIDASWRQHMITQTFPTASSVIDQTFKSPANLNYSSIASTTIPLGHSYAVPPNAPQAGSAILIDTSDGRFVNDQTQYGDNLWAAHSEGIGAFPIPFFYNFDVEGPGVDTVKQSGAFFSSATSFDWNASIAAHQDGRAYVTWSNTDSTVPRTYVGGRIATDAAGAMTKVLADTSPGPITANGNPSRWGDTSSVRFESPAGIVASAFNERSGTTTCGVGCWGSRFVRFSNS